MTLVVEELNADANCRTYLLCDGRRAVLVDPVRERVERYRRALAERGLELDKVLETHMHADHLMLSRELKDELGAPVYMHDKSPSPLVDHHVSDGDVLVLGDEKIVVRHTPGHTPDSVCYELPSARAVLTGDTLFIGGSGRTDFPGGDAGAQYDAVTQRLFKLDDDWVVWPAHDYKGNTSSTIGEEKKNNPRFAGKSRDEYIEIMAGLGLPFPDRIQEALQINQSGLEAEDIEVPMVQDVAKVPQIEPKAVASRLRSASPPLVIDVREPEEFTGELGHIEGALLVPLDLLKRRLPKLAGYVDREIVCVCRAGARSATATAVLRQAGFKHVTNMAGGMLAWNDATLPTQR
ncbi:MAG: MBL fold metallo-hydrolase [Polyangiales bacterium]